jgi:hypothetical protein
MLTVMVALDLSAVCGGAGRLLRRGRASPERASDQVLCPGPPQAVRAAAVRAAMRPKISERSTEVAGG